MSEWVKIPASIQLTNEFNALNPNRDKGADGDIGDANHSSSSDHTPDEDSDKLRNRDADHINEVHAKDIDSTGPWSGTTFDTIIQYIIGECRKPNDVGKDYGRFRYIIWDHHIYEAPNWEKVPYTATSDPHTNHAHFSFEYVTELENDTRPYGIIEKFGDDFPVDQETFDKLQMNSWKNPSVVNAFLDNVKVTDYADINKPQRVLSLRQWIGYAEGRAQVNLLHDTVENVENEVNGITTQVTELTKLVESHISGIIEGSKNAE